MVSVTLGVEMTLDGRVANVRTPSRVGKTLDGMTAVDGVGVGLVHGTTIVDGIGPPLASSGTCPMVLSMEQQDIIAEI